MTITEKTFSGYSFNTEAQAAFACLYMYVTACGRNSKEETIEWMKSQKDPDVLINDKAFVDWCAYSEPSEEDKDYAINLVLEQWDSVLSELEND